MLAARKANFLSLLVLAKKSRCSKCSQRPSICDCSALQSAVCFSKCLAAAPVFLLGATRHFVLLSCKICAEIVVYRMSAVFLNGLNGKNSSRSIVRNIFSVYFFYSRFQEDVDKTRNTEHCGTSRNILVHEKIKNNFHEKKLK